MLGVTKTQPRSQALSSLPPLAIGRKTLVAAGHVTTQNLGGKKVCWAGGVAECFDCCCGKLCGFQNLSRAVAKNYPLCRGLIWKFVVEECYIISAVSKISKTFVHKEIRQPNGAQTFRQLAHVKRHVPN